MKEGEDDPVRIMVRRRKSTVVGKERE